MVELFHVVDIVLDMLMCALADSVQLQPIAYRTKWNQVLLNSEPGEDTMKNFRFYSTTGNADIPGGLNDLGKLDNQTQIDLNVLVTQVEALLNEKLSAAEAFADDSSISLREKSVPQPCSSEYWAKVQGPNFSDVLPQNTSTKLLKEHNDRLIWAKGKQPLPDKVKTLDGAYVSEDRATNVEVSIACGVWLEKFEHAVC